MKPTSPLYMFTKSARAKIIAASKTFRLHVVPKGYVAGWSFALICQRKKHRQAAAKEGDRRASVVCRQVTPG